MLTFRFLMVAWARRLRAHFFTYFILGPLIAVGVYGMCRPYFDIIRDRVDVGAWTDADRLRFGMAVVLLLAAVQVPAALRRVFAVNSPDVVLEYLPVTPRARFAHLIVGLTGANLPPALLLAGGVGRLVDSQSGARPALAMVTFAVAHALSMTLVALLLARFSCLKPPRLVAILVCAAGCLALTTVSPLFFVPLMPLAAPVLAVVGRGFQTAILLPAVGVGTGLTAYRVYVVFRDRDADAVRASLSRGGRSWAEPLAGLFRRRSPVLAAQLERDLALTLRAFSPAVPAAAAFAALFQVAVVYLGRTLAPASRALVVQACCALTVFSLASLTVLLLRYQLRFFWIEKTTGLDPDEIRRAKTTLAAILAAVGFLVAAVVAVVTGHAELLPRLAAISLSVGALVGVLTFEISDQPVLGLVLAGVGAFGMAALFMVYWSLWPFWLFSLAYAMHTLAQRARTRAFFAEIEND